MRIDTKTEPEPAPDPPSALLSTPPFLTADFNESRPAITVDYETYAHHFADSGMSEDEARACLHALANILVEFVAMGFDVHPVQQAQNARGQLSASALRPTDRAVSVIDCDDNPGTGETEEAREEHAR